VITGDDELDCEAAHLVPKVRDDVTTHSALLCSMLTHLGVQGIVGYTFTCKSAHI
jgi:hypothetical protein